MPDPFCCSVCGARLVRADTYWVCPMALHSKAVPDSELRYSHGFADELKRSWRQMPFVRSLKRLLERVG